MSNVTKLPNTTTVKIGELDLQCRLDGRAVMAIEKRLDESLIGLFIKGQGEMKLPPSNKLLIVLSQANKTHGVKEKDIVNAFYDHVDNGGSTMDLFESVNELIDEAGFFGKEKDNADESTDVTDGLDSNPEESSEL